MADDGDIPTRWRRRTRISWCFFVVGAMLTIPFILIRGGHAVRYWFLIIGFLIMLMGWVFRRCPACSKEVDTRGAAPSYCPHCGVKLRD